MPLEPGTKGHGIFPKQENILFFINNEQTRKNIRWQVFWFSFTVNITNTKEIPNVPPNKLGINKWLPEKITPISTLNKSYGIGEGVFIAHGW